MIKEIDSLLRLWGQELHSDLSKGGLAGGNMVAMMMDTNGQLIRGRRAFRAPLESSLDIELIVNKHLRAEQATRKINGGLNGLADRLQLWTRARAVLCVSSI